MDLHAKKDPGLNFRPNFTLKGYSNMMAVAWGGGAQGTHCGGLHVCGTLLPSKVRRQTFIVLLTSIFAPSSGNKL